MTPSTGNSIYSSLHYSEEFTGATTALTIGFSGIRSQNKVNEADLCKI